MKRSEIKRKTPLRSTSTLARTPFKSRTCQLDQFGKLTAKPLRHSKPKADKPKRAAREAEDRHLLDLCRGQRCYLAIPGICNHDRATVVPCHSNSLARGKGMGLKAPHKFTVPGCCACHHAIDAGRDLDKEVRRAIWESAYERWGRDRKILLEQETATAGAISQTM